MATQMFLRSVASDLGGSGQLSLKTVRGAGSSNLITNTTASGTSIPVTDTAGGTAVTFFSDGLNAITLSGNLTINIRGKESNASANAGAGIKIEHCDSTGSVLGTILAEQTIPGSITEYSTSDAAKVGSNVVITSTAFSNGDRIKVTLLVKNAGTMGGSQTVTNTIDGPTLSAAGDTYVTFTEAITFVAIVTNNFSGLTAGTTVSSGNTGGASGTALDGVGSGGSTPVVVAGGAHSPVCIAIDNANTTVLSYVSWLGTGPFGVQTTVYYEMYVKISANPGNPSLRLFNITSTSSVTTVFLNASGKLAVTYGSSGTPFVTFTNVVPIGSWFRLEGFVIISITAGQVGLSLFSSSMDATTPDETHTSGSSLNTGNATTALTCTFGSSTTIAMTSPILISDIGLSSTGPLGIAKLLSSGSIAMHKMGLSATGTDQMSATGSIRMHKMGLSATGTVSTGVTGTGSIRMHKMGLSAAGIEKVSATGSIRMHKMGLSAAGIEKVSATGSIRMHKMGLSAAGTVYFVATGSIRMHKMGLSAAGIEKVSATGSIRMHKMKLSGAGTIAFNGPLYNHLQGTNGTAVTTGNSGGSDGSAFSQVNIPSGGTLAYDTTHPIHGSSSVKVATGSTSGANWAIWKLPGTDTTLWYELYLYFTANPSGTLIVAKGENLTGGSQSFVLNVTALGKIQVLDANNATVFTGSVSIPLNQPFRVEFFVTGSATVGQVETQLFKTAESTVPDEIKTSLATVNTRQPVQRIDWGTFGSNTTPYWMGEVAVSNSGYIGPIDVPGTGSIRMHKMGLSAAGIEKVSVTVSIRMHKMGLSGSGIAYEVVTGSIQMHKMGLSGTGTDKMSATGSISLHKMRLSGTGISRVSVSGSIAMRKMHIQGTDIPPHASNLFIFTAV